MKDKNFVIRTLVTIVLAVVAISSLVILNGLIFKVLIIAFLVVAGIELLSFLKKKRTPLNIALLCFEMVFLIGCGVFALSTGLYYYIYVILGVPGYDIFAYLFGKAFGGKVFKKSRPFPKISKNKTWEGTLLGLAMSMALVAILLVTCDAPFHDYIFLLSGPLALIGDLFESWLKRKFDIKDSNEIVIKNPVFKRIEYVVGGSNGHGGFLDRIDSVAVATTILYILMKWLVF